MSFTSAMLLHLPTCISGVKLESPLAPRYCKRYYSSIFQYHNTTQWYQSGRPMILHQVLIHHGNNRPVPEKFTMQYCTMLLQHGTNRPVPVLCTKHYTSINGIPEPHLVVTGYSSVNSSYWFQNRDAQAHCAVRIHKIMFSSLMAKTWWLQLGGIYVPIILKY